MNSGVFILDKPEGFTSFDAVAVMRGLFGLKKIGHTGTLDPMATGVLVMLLGSAAKALPYLEDTDKTYEAGVLFGVKTDTQDSTGKVLLQSGKRLTEEEVRNVLPSFTGSILQVPPMYSAISKDGVRLYALARKGVEVEREARPVRISTLELSSFSEEEQKGLLRVTCSKGTYIRTLCADIGERAGSCGIMTSLRRTCACGFDIAGALTLDESRKRAAEGTLWDSVRGVDVLFENFRSTAVSQAQAQRFRSGGALDLKRVSLRDAAEAEYVRVYDGEERFVGLGKVEEGQISVLKCFT